MYDENDDAEAKGYGYAEECCAVCGADPDEECADGCPAAGVRCGSCGLPWATWVPAADAYRCEACGPLSTPAARMQRGDL